MTSDGLSGTSIEYNHLDLPRKIIGNGGISVEYSYLSDGSKSKAVRSDGTGLVYRGSLTYRKAANGSLTLEGADVPEGRLTPNGLRMYVTDHLGSVRAVIDGATGNLYTAKDYEAYGTSSMNATGSSYLTTAPTGETFRQGFTGQEDQGPDFSLPYTDYGARQYSPALRRWLVPDPMSEKYYGISPYAYCAGDPVNLVDPKGMDYWILSRDGSLTHLCDNKENRLYAVDKDNRITGEYFQDYTTNRLFEQLKNKYSKTDENKHKTYNVSSVENLSGNVALQLFKFLSDNTYVEWAMHGTTEFTVGTLHDSSDGGNWSMYGLDSRPKFSIHSHPGDNYTTDEEQRVSASDDWDNMKKSPESKAKYYYIYFPVTGTYSRLKTTHMQKNGPLPFFYNKIKRD